jgi:hypothetical protein
MKCKLIYSLFIVPLLFAGCDRQTTGSNKSNYSRSLAGAWELRSLFGGFRAPGPDPVYSPGNGNIWSFRDSTFRQYYEGKLVDSGSFSIIRDTCPATQTLMDAFVTSKSHGHRMFFEISKDTLTIYNGIIAADGTIEKYFRLSDTH